MVQTRDRFIGWNPQQRRAHLKSIANNSRFLILPSVGTDSSSGIASSEPMRPTGASEERIREYQEHLEDLVRVRTLALESARLQAEAANRAKTDFLANTSHALRTPLNVVIGFSSVLLDGLAGELSEQQREHPQDILDSGRRLRALVEGMQAVAQTENGTLAFASRNFPLRDVSEATELRFESLALNRSIDLRLELAPEADVEIEADRGQLERIVGNLIDNGIKFTPADGTVTVRVRRDGESVEIAIEDSWIGISPADLGRRSSRSASWKRR